MTGRQKMIIGWSTLIVGWLIVFAIMEGYALTHDDAITLSRFVFEISNAWPPVIFLLGLTVGILVAHFWWRWNPTDLRDRRG